MPTVFRHDAVASRFLAVSTDYLFARRRASDRPQPAARIPRPQPHWLPRPSPRPAPAPAHPMGRSGDLAQAAHA
jgi:hypothetical protein